MRDIAAPVGTLVRVAAMLSLWTLACLESAHAQQPITAPTSPYVELGLDPSAVVTRPTGTLESVRGTAPCSEVYEPTTRVNPSLLAFVSYVFDGREYPFGTVALRALRLSAGYDDISSEWIAPSERYPAFNDATNTYTDVETQFATDYDLKYVRAAIELESTLGMNIGFRIGPSISVPISASSEQRESIVAPSGATFRDRTQKRVLADGTGVIDDAGTRVGIGAALSYRLPLGRRFFFEPTATVDVGITSVQPDWSPLELRLGIAMGYALFSEPMLPPPTPEPVVIERVPDPVLEAFRATVDVRLANDKPIELRRQIISRYTPLIPVVFFDENANSMAERYRRLAPSSADAFSEQAISTAADMAHLDVLNVLGARLQANPEVTMTLTGTTSDDETDREVLARARAESVASYFENAWSIPRSRMSVRGRIDPAVPTSSETEDGRVENRRVEVAVSDESLLSPVLQRTVEPVNEPRTIGFDPTAVANQPLKRWMMQIGGDGGRQLTGTGPVPESITWELTQDDRERLLVGGSSEYRLTVEDFRGTTVSSTTRSMPLKLDTTVTVATSASRPDNSAEFLLITFEFDQARLTERGRRELETITDRIGKTSTVSVTGYTDRIGEAEHNLALARERAERVAAQLPKAAGVDVRGADQSEAPYTNDSPEGRFLSRTVRVVIINPK